MNPKAEAAKADARGWLLAASMPHMQDALLEAEQGRRKKWAEIGIDFPANNRICLPLHKVAEDVTQFISPGGYEAWRQLVIGDNMFSVFEQVPYDDLSSYLLHSLLYTPFGMEKRFEPFKLGRELVLSIALEDMSFASDYASFGSCLRMFGQATGCRHAGGGRWYATTTSMGVVAVENVNKILSPAECSDRPEWFNKRPLPKFPAKISRRWLVLGKNKKAVPSVFFWKQYNGLTVSLLPLVSLLKARGIDVTPNMELTIEPSWFQSVFMDSNLRTCKVYIDQIRYSESHAAVLDFPEAAHYDTALSPLSGESPAGYMQCAVCAELQAMVTDNNWLLANAPKSELIIPKEAGAVQEYNALCPKCTKEWSRDKCVLCNIPLFATRVTWYEMQGKKELVHVKSCQPCVDKEKIKTERCEGCGRRRKQIKSNQKCKICTAGYNLETTEKNLRAATMKIAHNILRTLGD